MTGLIAAAGPSPLWYLTRGAGAMTLALLTVSVVLGILNMRRWRTERWPRFVVDGLHRNVSLVVLLILAIHVITAVADSFAPIGLKDAVVPFVSAYRPIWVGLGALAFDLLLAVTLTSLLRQHLGHVAWRRVHWLAYAVWPVALVHGLGAGTDASSTWMLGLTITCMAAVWIAASVRVIAASPDAAGARIGGAATLLLAPIALAVWLPSGPLGAAWARRAGTPPALLGAPVRSTKAKPGSGAARRALVAPFTGRLTGTARQAETAAGLASVDLRMRFAGDSPGVINIRIQGQPVEGGGVQMTRSALTLGPSSSPRAYRGQVVALQGQRLVATASGPRGAVLRLDLTLAIDSASQGVNGTIRANPEGASP